MAHSLHSTSTPPVAAGGDRHTQGWLKGWPTVLGLGTATLLLITGAASRDTLAIGATAAAWCYLAAAASGRPWVAWVAIPGSSLVVVLSEVMGMPWWAGLALGSLILVVVALRRERPDAVLLAQAAAFAAIGLLAVLALSLDPRAGVVLAGLVLASHAIWDAIHHHRRIAVPRSLAEACFSLDLLLGLGLVAVVVFAW
ncbi:hypothetical protein [Nocardioides insulae]|uniref:hypothetical protein n=1 Tax=Nocardioides insulae TaxID=394734 RepID=UPI00040B0B6C|nr:hypothetical protein [Nocardioides insulae]